MRCRALQTIMGVSGMGYLGLAALIVLWYFIVVHMSRIEDESKTQKQAVREEELLHSDDLKKEF